MSIHVGVSTARVRIPISRDRVAEIGRDVLRSERVNDAMLSVTFVSARAIRALNRRHLRRDWVTDVLAFTLSATGKQSPIVGDVYIAPDVARDSARAADVPIREEIVRLVVHGTLHVLGHDHPEGDTRMRSPMWKKQEALVRRLAGRTR